MSQKIEFDVTYGKPVDRSMAVDIVVADHAYLPHYAHPGDAGADICAAVTQNETLWPGERRAIPTGLRVRVPTGYEMQIRSRSGLSLKGIVVANAPGTIDSGFRGEVKVILHNAGDQPFVIEPGMRIAQAVFAPVMQAVFLLRDDLDETARGEGGFGSTGVA